MTAVVEILERPECSLNRQVEVMSPLNDAELTFKPGKIGEAQCDSVVLWNHSTNVYTIQRAQLAHQIGFSLKLSQFPVVILPGEMHALEVCYTAVDASVRRDTLLIGSDCPLRIPLATTGLSSEVYAEDHAIFKARTGAFESMLMYPNPALTTINVSVVTLCAGSVSAEIFSVNGRRVQTIPEITWDIGTHSRQLDISMLPAGNYLLKLSAGSQFRVSEFSIVR